MLSRCLCRFSLLLAGLLALPALVAGLPTVPLAPLAPGMQMTCQFLNQTQGERSDSQIFVLIIVRNAAGQFCWVNAAGQLIPCVSGDNTLDKFLPLSSFSALQFPATMTSGRLYLALDSPLNIQFNTAGDGSVGIAFPDINNPGDASVGHDFDWIEFAVINNAIWCNTTQVDMFGIPLTLQLYQGAAGGYSLHSEAGITESAQALREAFAAEVPAEFQPLVVPHRIKAPIHDALGSSGYFDAYIDAVWAQYRTADLVIPSASGTYTGRVGLDGRLAFRRPGDGATYYVSKPSTREVWGGLGALASGNWAELMLEAKICAGFHRHVMQDASKLDDVASYYQAGPADYFAKFWHEHSLGAKAYGFCYDDVNEQSSTLSCGSPRGLVIGIGPMLRHGSPSPTATLSPTRSATFTATRTRSATATPSPSATPTGSPTGSATPTATASPSISRTATATPSASPTVSATATPSATASGSPTASASPTPSGTPSRSATPSPSPTASATGSATPSVSASASATPSPSRSATPSATASATPTRSSTPALAASATRSPSAQATPSASPTVSASPTATPTAWAQPSPLPTATASPSAFAEVGAPPTVLQHAAWPNPYTGAGRAFLQLRLGGPAERVELDLYAVSLAQARHASYGPLAQGWNQVALPGADDLPNGLYYYRVRSFAGGRALPQKAVGRWLLQR